MDKKERGLKHGLQARTDQIRELWNLLHGLRGETADWLYGRTGKDRTAEDGRTQGRTRKEDHKEEGEIMVRELVKRNITDDKFYVENLDDFIEDYDEIIWIFFNFDLSFCQSIELLRELKIIVRSIFIVKFA